MFFLLRAPLSLHHIAILLWLTFMAFANVDSQITRSSNITCKDSESWALLKFKSNLDSKNRLSNWSNKNMDCCGWEGIRCSKSGHVVTMDLHSPWSLYMECITEACMNFSRIAGEISPSLLNLTYLNYLDLSNNDFKEIPIFFGSMKRLKYLNLSYNPLIGEVPRQLGNLSVLESLDLNMNYASSRPQVDSLTWITGLTSLKYLDMSYVDLEAAQDWLQSVSKLPSLVNLYLKSCSFPFTTNIEVNASTSLEVVDLSSWYIFNVTDGSLSYLPSSILDYLSKMVSIKHLYLSSCGLEGALPETFSDLRNLTTLDVSENMLNESYGFLQSGSNSLQELRVNKNKLQGPLPNLSKFPSLQVLNLANNEFNGSLAHLLWRTSNLSVLDVSSNHFHGNLSRIPFFSKVTTLQVLNLAQNELGGSLAQVLLQNSNLTELDVSSNHFLGTLTEAHFQNLTKLQFLSFSSNSLTLNFSTWFTHPFQLTVLRLRACSLGKIFPHWLRNQKNIIHLDISNSGISDEIPSWFWDITPQMEYLNVSHNTMSGLLPPNSLSSCMIVDLSFNRFHGTLPSFSKSKKLRLLYVSSNRFSGDISFLCGLNGAFVNYLDFSNNNLSGILPNCWESIGISLNYLNLNNNKFTGLLPSSMGSLSHVVSLRLRNNNFSGSLPPFLEKCTCLFLLDLGENQFSGVIPDWIGTSLTELRILRLNRNKFERNIPSTLCYLNQLQILDISFNNISGNIPSCLNNFTAMTQRHTYTDNSLLFDMGFHVYGDVTEISDLDDFTAKVFWKGLQVELKNGKFIELLNYIDLSSNKLSGVIPDELISLNELVSLNISHNVLSGPIRDKIGEMSMLETLDLSHNLLSGQIPLTVAKWFAISYLDLSYNNLTGSIPVSSQLATFDANTYIGNPGLCGAPLPDLCHQGRKADYALPKGREVSEKLWMYISMGLGFIVGFWGVCGTLLANGVWGERYFQSLTDIEERLFMAIIAGFAKLRRRFSS